MLVEAKARLIILPGSRIVVEGPGAARPVHEVAVLLRTSPEAAHPALVAFLVPLLGSQVVIVIDWRNEFVAPLAASLGEVMIACKLKTDTLQWHGTFTLLRKISGAGLG